MATAQQRDALVNSGIVDGTTVHWGKQDFTLAEYAQFQNNLSKIAVTDKQMAVLRAVHDGTPIPSTEERVSPTHVTADQLLDRATIDKNGTLHIGKLTVDAGIAEDFQLALRGAKNDPEFAAMVEEAAKRGMNIHQDQDANSREMSPTEVYWDSRHLATDYYNESNLSTGRTLKHEMSHAQRDPDVQKILLAIPDGRYSNREEHAAIDNEHRYQKRNEMQRDSHIANESRTVTGPNESPQTCADPEIGVHVSEVKDGQRGTPVYKSSGQIKGKIDTITNEVDPQNGLTYRVLHMTDDGGKKIDVKFESTLKDIDAEANPGHPHPVTSLTWNVRNGDDVTIKFDNAHRSATIDNRTQGYHRESDPYGKSTETPLTPPAPKHDLAPAR